MAKLFIKKFQYLIIALSILLGWLIVDKCIVKDESKALLEYALQLSGNNQKELNKVLEHYQQNPADSLKYKAACFLIKNMPYYYSYIPNETIDSLKRMKVKLKEGWISSKTIEEWSWFRHESLPKIRDIDVVTADLLIENIDYAFKAWNKRAWSSNYTFDNFCEYILPYRIGNESLEKWRKTYYDRYSVIYDSLYQGDDVVEAARQIAVYLKSEKFYNRIDFNLPHMGASFLLENRVGFCRDACDLASYVMRSLGIPIAMDEYHMSPSYHSRHFWSAIIDTTGIAVPFNFDEFPPKRGANNERKRGKVYRHFFGKQNIDKNIANNTEIPILFRNIFLRDVTEQYYPDNGFNITIEGSPTDKYVYLAIYDHNSLIPIDIAPVNGKTARFKNVENDLIYQPVFCKNGITSLAGHPFLLKKGSVPSYLIPDTRKKKSEILNRKYPMRYTHTFLHSAAGLQFEGSNSLDFRYSKLLHEVIDTPKINYNKIYISKPYACRYVRITQKYNKIQIAELSFFAKDKKIPIQRWGRSANKMDSQSYEKKAFDNDWVSYFVTYEKPLILDFGKTNRFTEFVLIPRNDDNFIHLGDSYELFYQNGLKGWESLGKQVADTTYLIYNNIPDNALLLLRNLTRGKEERPFYMEKEKQIFP